MPPQTSPAGHPGRRRRLQFALLATGLFLLLLLAIEGAVRLFLPTLDPLDVFLRSEADQANLSDRESVRIFAGDPLLFWRLKPDLDEVIWDFTLVSTNPQGLRHPRPLEPKPEGGLRVVALGDSVTFGYRVPLVWPEQPERWDPTQQPYPRLLEVGLAAANPGRPVEVVALAVPGFTSHQGLAWLRREIEGLDPDLVIACFGWNDVTLRGRRDSEGMAADPALVRRRALLSRSQVLLRIARSLGDRRGPGLTGAPPVPRVPVDEYIANLVAVVRLAEDHGGRGLVVGPVFRDPDELPEAAVRLANHRTALRRAMQREGLPYLEIPELTQAWWPDNRALFGESIHPNERGHRLLAEEIATTIAEQGLLPGWNPPLNEGLENEPLPPDRRE